MSSSGRAARRVDGPAGAADDGRADLRQIDGDARFGAAEGAGSAVGACWLLGLGITAMLAANVARGLGYGPSGAVVAAWPAAALVGSDELLMAIIGSGQAPAGLAVRQGAAPGVPSDDPLHAQATEEFAREVAAGRCPQSA